MALFSRFWRRKKDPGPKKLYVMGEEVTVETMEMLETKLGRLERWQPLLENREILQEFFNDVLAQPAADMVDPLVVQESAQFYRGAFWLEKQTMTRLANLEKEIDFTEKRIKEESKKQPVRG